MAHDGDRGGYRAGTVDVDHGESRSWHAVSIAEVADLLDTSPAGLSEADAAERLDRHGRNQLPEEPPPRALTVFLRQFVNPLIFILVVAAGITLVMGELLDTILIAAALLLNAIIGFTQERRAAGAVRALMSMVVPRSRVVRDGHHRVVDSAELVPGDLVVLEPGARVPADLRLSAAAALQIDESLLTGESLPVTKRGAAVEPPAGLADRPSMAFTGTIVTGGQGRGYVVATGPGTELGQIAGLISVEDPTTSPLHIGWWGMPSASIRPS